MIPARSAAAKMQKKMLGLSVETDYLSGYGINLGSIDATQTAWSMARRGGGLK
jgi:hypothetical protein